MRNDIANQSKARSRYFQAKFWGKIVFAVVVAVVACFGIVRWQDYQVDYWQRFTAKRHERLRALPEIAIGDLAPDFAVRTKDGQQTVELHNVAREKPVALVFGSYT